MHSQLASKGLKSLALGTALSAALLATGNIRAEEQSAAAVGGPRFDHAAALAFVDLAGLRESLNKSEDSEFYKRWHREVMLLLTRGSDVEPTQAARGMWVFFDGHAVAVLEFNKPLDESDALAWFHEQPQRDQAHGSRLYRIPGAGAVVQFVGERILLLGDGDAAVAPFQHATEQQIAPRQLLAAHGGDPAADVFLAANRPFPFALPGEAAEAAGGEESAFAGVRAIQFTFNSKADVPLRLVFATDSKASAAKTSRFLADCLGDFHFNYDQSERQRLLEDKTAPHTDRYIDDIDRMLRRTLIGQRGSEVEVTVNLPGGMPNFYPLVLHELARATLRTRPTFESVSDQLRELEETTVDSDPAASVE
ncbi:MAG: hypothetical protein RIC55_27850 [Pirellulaceae bacterium]